MVEPEKNTADSPKNGPGMDHHEFARQFQSIYPRLWLMAASLVGDRSDAEDIVQEAAIIAFRKQDAFIPGTSFGAWVARIVRLCAANHNRKSTRRRTKTMDPVALDQRSGEPVNPFGDDGRCDWHATLDDEMLRVLSQLTPDARSCLLLRVVDGLSYQEIGDLLGIPTGTAMSHVHRSRKYLRRGLRGDYPVSGGGNDE